MNPHVSLASPFHDPEARLLPLLKRYGKKLYALYEGNVAVSISKATASEVIDELLALPVQIIPQQAGKTAIGANYLYALKKSLTFSTEVVHLLDFDRALHWIHTYPGELATVRANLASSHGLTLFNRTPRAFATHPNVQRTTERTVNELATRLVGKTVDILSGSFAFDRKTAYLILKHATTGDYGFYAEVLQIAHRHTVSLHCLEVDGLEWETPDQFQPEIKKVGYETWLASFESPYEWKKRRQIVTDSEKILLKV